MCRFVPRRLSLLFFRGAFCSPIADSSKAFVNYVELTCSDSRSFEQEFHKPLFTLVVV